MQKLFDQLLVIGTGLIGGSVAKGLKERGLVGCVEGYGRNLVSLKKGVDAGVIDAAAEDLEKAISEADVILLAVPTLAIKHYLPMIEKYKKPQSIVTDAASVKGDVATVIAQHFGEVPSWFVLGHPIAGSEKSGILAANPNLYENHKVILTPLTNTNVAASQLVTQLWQGLGADVVEMSIEQHDKVLAATSHLPHLLAFTLVDCLQNLDVNVDIFRFAAGGFRDFTRIAGSDPTMWHDIMLANKTAILQNLGAFKETLNEIEQAIEQDDSDKIRDSFTRAKASRAHFQQLLDKKKS